MQMFSIEVFGAVPKREHVRKNQFILKEISAWKVICFEVPVHWKMFGRVSGLQSISLEYMLIYLLLIFCV